MILYHGSFQPVELPEIRTNEVGRDFGFAFYTTDIKEQAVRWAVRKAKLMHRNGKFDCKAVISRYNWAEDAANESLNIKRFCGPSEEWLELILHCRSDLAYKHNFDVVIGNIANDNVGETVSFVLQGIMRKEDAIERLKFEKINNQVAFCTKRALVQLEYLDVFTQEV